MYLHNNLPLGGGFPGVPGLAAGRLEDLLLAAGVLLILAGALLVATWSPEPRLVTGAQPVHIPRLEIRGPGVLELNTTRYPASYEGYGETGEGPVVASLYLPPPYRECGDVERYLEYHVGGVLGGGGAPLTVAVEALLANGSRVTVQEYTLEVPRLPGTGPYATATPLLLDGKTIGTAQLSDGGVEVRLVDEVPVPLEAKAVNLTVETSIPGNVTVNVRVKDVCHNTYVMDKPYLAPAGYETVWIRYPTGVELDTTGLSTGIALIAVGNMLALLGVYLRASRA